MRTTFLFVWVLFALSSQAQNFSVGCEAGFISSYNSVEIQRIWDHTENRRNTYFSGLNLNFKLDERLTFSTGLHYLRQGATQTTCFVFADGVKNQMIQKIDHLSIPITANYHLLKSRKLIVSLGLINSFNIKAVQEHPEPIGGCKIYYIPDLSFSTQPHSISGVFGIGYKVLESGNFEVISNVKYIQGLSNTYLNPYPNLKSSIVKKHSSALLTVSLNYKI